VGAAARTGEGGGRIVGGVPAAFRGAVPATTLKVAGIDLFCGGEAAPASGDDEVIVLGSRRGRYRRLLLRDERLVGTILLGDLRDAALLREHLGAHGRLPEALLEPMPAGRATAVVGECTRAGTGCGTCRATIEALLARTATVAAAPG
jgi:NAD(P)H-nitrite reductase large subunit